MNLVVNAAGEKVQAFGINLFICNGVNLPFVLPGFILFKKRPVFASPFAFLFQNFQLSPFAVKNLSLRYELNPYKIGNNS